MGKLRPREESGVNQGSLAGWLQSWDDNDDGGVIIANSSWACHVPGPVLSVLCLSTYLIHAINSEGRNSSVFAFDRGGNRHREVKPPAEGCRANP